jgi:hypothetical protein
MALTLRPTDVVRSPAMADLEESPSVASTKSTRRQTRTWRGSGRLPLTSNRALDCAPSGTTETLDAAKAAFRATWDQWQSWAAKAGFDSRPG